MVCRSDQPRLLRDRWQFWGMGQNLLQQITAHTCHPGAWLQAAVVKRGEGCYVNKPSSAGSFWANHRPEFLFDRVCAPPGWEGETSWHSEKSPSVDWRTGRGSDKREALCTNQKVSRSYLACLRSVPGIIQTRNKPANPRT